MRRVAVTTLVGLLVAACTATGPADPTTTTTTVAATSSVTPPPIGDSLPVWPECRDVESDVADYLIALGLGHLEVLRFQGDGPLAEYLPQDYAFAEQLGMECFGVYSASSGFGELAQVTVAWNDEQTHAAVGGLVRRGLVGTVDEGIRVDLDRGPVTELRAVDDEIWLGRYHDWWVADSLEGVVAVAGDDPFAALGAWNRTRRGDAELPIFTIAQSDGWGGNSPVYHLYVDGLLLVERPGGGPFPTFENQLRAYHLTPDEVASLDAQALATGIVAGEDFDPPAGIVDAGSIWFTYRYDDVAYMGSVYAPRFGDLTPEREMVIDLFEDLEQLTASPDWVALEPEAIVVRAVARGVGAEGNALPWEGSFDLSAAATKGCTLLEGAEAHSYLDDVSMIGDDYRGREETVFAQSFSTWAVTATALRPWEVEEQFAALHECRTTDVRQADPSLAAWLWGARGITDYEITLDILSCPFDWCDESEVTLDGEQPVEMPLFWGEFLDPSGTDPARHPLRAIEDLFTLAGNGDLELESFITDGIVGIPLELVVTYPASGGAKLIVRTTYFETELGTLRVDFDENVGISMIPTGFDEWMAF